MNVHEIRAVLTAYKEVAESGWPNLHPFLEADSRRWNVASESELGAVLATYLDESSRAEVRVFWKFGPKLVFGGCNDYFAGFVGLSAREVVGLTDWDEQIPWKRQAAKYRGDDRKVLDTGIASLDLVERQLRPDGRTTHWMRTSKAAIRLPGGEIIGVLGLSSTLDEASRAQYVPGLASLSA